MLSRKAINLNGIYPERKANEIYKVGYWLPVIYIRHIDGSSGGGEIGEGCIRLATDGEVRDGVLEKFIPFCL